jgi:hypothetical protein
MILFLFDALILPHHRHTVVTGSSTLLNAARILLATGEQSPGDDRRAVRRIVVVNVEDPTDSSLETCNMTLACRRRGRA